MSRAGELMPGSSRSQLLLVLGCAAGAALLAGSQFTNLFELTPPVMKIFVPVIE